ncbi:MAG: ABC transporter ATP-binding protein [Oligoflexia bacterium]|nr:ABC transporter ATP-binding protein [Oligoflexia bacterium]
MLRFLYQEVKKHFFLESIVVVLIFASIGFNLAIPMVNRELVDEAIGKGNSELLFSLLWVYLAVIICGEGINFLMEYLQNKVQERISVDLYLKLFKKLLTVCPRYLQEYSEAELVNRFLIDIESMKSLIADFFITILTQSVYFIAILIVMLNLSWKLTLLVLIPIIIYPLIFRLGNERIRFFTQVIRKQYDQITASLQETIRGVVEIKIYALEEKVQTPFAQTMLTLYKTILKSVIQNNLLKIAINSSSLMANLLLWFYGGYLVIQKDLTLGTLWALTTYLSQLYGPIQIFASNNFRLQRATVALERIHRLLIMPDDYTEDLTSKLWSPITFKKELVIKNLSFSYEQGKRVFKQLSFTLHPGDRLWIKGSNGSGKTTLIKILLGLYPDYEGSITLDGNLLSKIPLNRYREYFAYVSQHAFLFRDTIENNIGVSSLASPSSLSILSVLKDSIPFLKASMQTQAVVVREGGSNLSGGERQLIAMARALCKQAPILIIDEGMTNIDVQTRKKLDELIDHEFQYKTIIRISHQDSSEGLDHYTVLDLDEKI